MAHSLQKRVHGILACARVGHTEAPQVRCHLRNAARPPPSKNTVDLHGKALLRFCLDHHLTVCAVAGMHDPLRLICQLGPGMGNLYLPEGQAWPPGTYRQLVCQSYPVLPVVGSDFGPAHQHYPGRWHRARSLLERVQTDHVPVPVHYHTWCAPVFARATVCADGGLRGWIGSIMGGCFRHLCGGDRVVTHKS